MATLNGVHDEKDVVVFSSWWRKKYSIVKS